MEITNLIDGGQKVVGESVSMVSAQIDKNPAASEEVNASNDTLSRPSSKSAELWNRTPLPRIRCQAAVRQAVGPDNGNPDLEGQVR